MPARASVRDRMRARLAALAAETRLVLQMASVLGDRFEVDLLARMSERPLEEVLAALEEGRAEGLIAVDPPRQARFCHALLRSVVYEDSALGERLRFHLLTARALEQTFDPLQGPPRRCALTLDSALFPVNADLESWLLPTKPSHGRRPRC